MVDYVVLKRLTLNSDLGWFKSVFDGHGLRTKQKAITLNKEVMNAIWPSLLARQDAYESAKTAMSAARKLGSTGKPVVDLEKAKAKAIGTIPIQIELHGPGGKPAMNLNRIIALQDKNWRLNGDFIIAPSSDPARFYPVLQEGDLALVGFDGAEWPTAATVVLLSQLADTVIWSNLEARVSKGARSMVQVDQTDIQSLAQKLNLLAGHVMWRIAGAPVVAAPTTIDVAVQASQRPAPQKPTPTPATTPEQLEARLAAAALVGQLGEKMVDVYLTAQQMTGVSIHTWVSRKFAEHPYDFEILSASGSVESVIDAKATSQAWTAEFFMSSGEITYAASSAVPYRIYRISGVIADGGELRKSDDIRIFARSVAQSLLASSPVGTRPTGVAVHPVNSGISWSSPIVLSPVR